MQDHQLSGLEDSRKEDLVNVGLRIPSDLLQSIIIKSFRTSQPRTSSNVGFATYLLEHRRRRQHSFPMRIACDPFMSIILDLYLTSCQKRAADVTSLSIASGAPFSSGMRYVDKLVSMGMAVRATDPSDKRRAKIYLSDDCQKSLEHWFHKETCHLIHDFISIYVMSDLRDTV